MEIPREREGGEERLSFTWKFLEKKGGKRSREKRRGEERREMEIPRGGISGNSSRGEREGREKRRGEEISGNSSEGVSRNSLRERTGEERRREIIIHVEIPREKGGRKGEERR